MVEYSWPKQGSAALLGTEQDRIDGVAKASGVAKYSYDINPDGVLMAKALGCPHAHCTIKSIDVSPAQGMPGVQAARALKQPGNEIRWQGDLVACVVAETEALATEALQKVKVEYDLLPVFVKEENLAAAEAMKRTAKAGQNVQLLNEVSDDEDEEAFAEKEIAKLLKESAVVIEGEYGIHVITHMCLEPHGSTCEWKDGKLVAHLSTQNVSGTRAQFAGPLGITAGDVTVHCDFIGGGFGSKFAADTWGVLAAELARETKRPVKLMLDRDLELKNAGCRPSGFIKFKVGADKDGVVVVWDSHHWGTAGAGAGGVNLATIPYVFDPKNRRRRATSVLTDTSPVRAWRAPNHPQAAAMSQTVYDDLAAKLGLDSYDVFLRNLPSVSPAKGSEKMSGLYADQMARAAKLIDWKAKWHPHGKGEVRGSIVSGLGMALHTWGGGGHNSTCSVKVHPDGGVEAILASQDLGTGTRTCIAMVVAETFGLPLEAVKVELGNSKYPESGPSGGSTTIGGVSESSRRGSQEVLAQLLAIVAEKLGVKPEALEARDGRIRVADDHGKGLGWKEACSLLGMRSLEARGVFDRKKLGKADSPLSSSQVGGVQMAEVEVDRDTGQVRVKKFVAVQDMGLVINRKTANSQIYGGVIMGIAYALFEERIMDATTGAFLNAEIADYKLPRLGDIGEIVIDIWEPENEYRRGVVGLGEPPVISPGAAISDAVCNALGVRVPVLPMTPKRVLDALQKGGKV